MTVTRNDAHAASRAPTRSPYAERLSVLFEQPENGTIAELGIGTNEAAKLCGIILEDEVTAPFTSPSARTPRSAASPKRTATSTASS
ncbi:MAG: hypothetical protein ACLUYK_01100 [Eggerthella lenta]